MNKKVIKEAVIVFSESESKSSKAIDFITPKNTERLFITYSYSPKLLENEEKAMELIKENLIRDAGDSADEYGSYGEFMPLKNLITVYLKSPSGFRGAAHRQAQQQFHEIDRNFASYGFLKGEIEAGEWSVVLNAHAVVTDKCECKIRIEAEVRE